MGKLTRRLVARGTGAARKAYEELETRVLVSEGRKAMRNKVRTTAKVGKKAAKTGLIVGALAAAGVVVREVRKRHKLG
jgi:hypothetical protein